MDIWPPRAGPHKETHPNPQMPDFPPAAEPLAALQPRKPFFIGIDSDGCVFDTMELKHKECFIPNLVKHWDLQAVSKYVRETAEFVNLYSRWRGINRWPGLVKTFDLLRERPEVRTRGAAIPELPAMRAFVASRFAQSNDGLIAFMRESGTAPDLERGLAWSNGVNASVSELARGVPPFPHVRDVLDRVFPEADLVVVSGTPGEALQREWEEHGLTRYPRLIAGQEMGKKAEHLALAAGSKYPKDRILMIGDAPGDLGAARAVGAHFFPICPGTEERSWERLLSEGLDRFFTGAFGGLFEDGLIRDFEARLPEVPPWSR